MKNKILVPIFLLGACLLYILSTYNSILTLEEHVKSQHAQIERINQYRFDLIPKLTVLVKNQQPDSSKQLSKAREQFVKASSKKKKHTAANKLEDQFLQFIATIQNDPDLKSNPSIKTLIKELNSHDKQVSAEKIRYNERVIAFNKAIEKNPKAFVAKIASIAAKKQIDS
ncbi:MAG: LemA family protein [Rhabdochlamydiaceae bacterium]|nr:LemA family protein [Candidatus Amphrikana amoebophyrae]